MGLYAFGNVKVQDNINLTIENGKTFELEITTGENIIPMMGIRIINNTLNINNESTCPMLKDPWKGIEIKLTVPTLDTLFINSHGSIRCLGTFISDSLVIRISDSPGTVDLDVDCNFFKIENFSGTADIKISGNTQRLGCYHAGYGKLNLTELHSDNMYFNTKSTNNCFVRGGNKYFYVAMAGIGNAYYYNDPGKIDLITSNTGRLIKITE